MNLAERYIGDRISFSVEKRIFHFICLILTIASLVGAIINLILKMPFYSILAAFVFTFLPLLFYYISRYRKRYALARNLFLIISYGFIIFFWHFDAGMNGYIHLLLFSVIVWQTVFTNNKNYFWFLLNVAVILILTISELYFPDLILWHHANKIDKALDLTFTYVIMGLTSFLIVRVLLSEYNEERESVSKKILN